MGQLNETAPVWDDGSWEPLPRLDGDASADVCVVGLGGAGLAAVFAARTHGCSVIGIDASAVGAGAAGRNGGFLIAGLAAFHHRAVVEHGHARALRAYRLTLDEIDRMAAETPGAVRRTGSHRLAVTDEEAADCDAQFEQMIADDLPVERWTDGPWGSGLTFPSDAAVHPLRRCWSLARTLRRGRDVQLFEGTRAIDVAPGHVLTPAGRIRCGLAIVAVDGGLEAIFPELVGTVRTARAQMLATAPFRRLPVTAPVYARQGYDYWQQLPDGCVCLGGGRDIGGEAEWSAAAVPTDTVQEHLDGLVGRLTDERAVITHRWAGTIAFTTTGLPFLGEVRHGVFATGAYSGTGNVFSSLCGRAAVELALDEPSEVAETLG